MYQKAALALFAALLVVYCVALSPAQATAFDTYYSDPIFLGVMIMLLIRAAYFARERNARLFFSMLAIGFALWLIVWPLAFVIPDTSGVQPSVVADVFYLLYFSVLGATIELRLDTRIDNRWLLQRVSAAVGVVLMFFAVFGYFAIIPAFVGEKDYQILLQLHATLDAYIGVRFLVGAWQTDEPRWRTLYLLFGGAFLLIALGDFEDWAQRSGVLEYVPGHVLTFAWYYWYPLAYVATAVQPLGPEKALDSTQSSETYPNNNGLLLFGFAMPLIHVGGYSLGLLDTEARPLRDLFIACWLIVIAASIFFVHRFIYLRLDLLDKRRVTAETKADQFEEQLQRELRIRSLGRLSSGLAHDFGNTMTALQMHAVAAERRAERGEPTTAEFEGVRKSVEYAKNMVGQLKLFGAADERVDAGPVALVAEVKQTLQLVRPSLPDRVDLTFSSTADVEVRALSSMIHQVVTNYLHNAVDAVGADGEIDVSVDVGEASARCGSCGEELSGTYAVLKVCDSGPGVAAELRDTVFEPLVTTKPVGLGSGLGLSSVHGIMHKLGGHVGVTHSPTGGACFMAYFPYPGPGSL